MNIKNVEKEILDSLRDGLYAVDATGEIRYANAALAEMMGYENPEAVIGRNLIEFVAQDYRANVAEVFGRVMKTGSEPDIFITSGVKCNGEKIWLEIRPGTKPGSVTRGLSIGTVHDITAARNAKLAEETSKSLHQLIVERSLDAIAILTGTGFIEAANTQALELFGFRDVAEIRGKHVIKFIAPDDHAKGLRDIRRLVVRGDLQDSEHMLLKADGRTFWAEVSGRKLPAIAGSSPAYFIQVRDISKRKSLESSLRSMSITDDLTGLYNRRGFTLAAEQELRHAKRTKSGIVFLFFDMDRLKEINDRFGHAEGDKALVQAADLLRSSFRDSDIIGRWGGDEFAVLALDVPSGCVDALHGRLDKNVAKRNGGKSVLYPITFSSGMVQFDPENPLSLHDMEKLADEMMYSQKSRKNPKLAAGQI